MLSARPLDLLNLKTSVVHSEPHPSLICYISRPFSHFPIKHSHLSNPMMATVLIVIFSKGWIMKELILPENEPIEDRLRTSYSSSSHMEKTRKHKCIPMLLPYMRMTSLMTSRMTNDAVYLNYVFPSFMLLLTRTTYYMWCHNVTNLSHDVMYLHHMLLFSIWLGQVSCSLSGMSSQPPVSSEWNIKNLGHFVSINRLSEIYWPQNVAVDLIPKIFLSWELGTY